MQEQTQDPIKAAPEVYSCLFENEKVRVLNVHSLPGQKTKLHFHPDRVIYPLADSIMKTTKSDGSVHIHELKKGKVVFMEAVSHLTENIGTTDMHAIAVELKHALTPSH